MKVQKTNQDRSMFVNCNIFLYNCILFGATIVFLHLLAFENLMDLFKVILKSMILGCFKIVQYIIKTTTKSCHKSNVLLTQKFVLIIIVTRIVTNGKPMRQQC